MGGSRRAKSRKCSIMRRRRRKHYMVGGGRNYSTGGAAVQQVSHPSSSDFASGFIAGYNSCVPTVHWHGYTHPI